MPTRSSAMLMVALLFLPVGASSQSLEPNSGNRECTKCSDLCYLVDLYWQKERGIEVWKRYAASTPLAMRTALPPEVTDLDKFAEFIYEQELPKAWSGRKLPCEAVQEWQKEPTTPPALHPGGLETGLETKVFDGSCEVVYRGQKLEGDTEKKWRATQVCKGVADAEVEHEKVHQKICRDTWDQNRFLAVKRLGLIRNVAESELQAWRRHRNMLRSEIQKLAKNCGWEPTDRQKADPASVPSEYQTKKMEEQGWKAFDALSGTPP